MKKPSLLKPGLSKSPLGMAGIAVFALALVGATAWALWPEPAPEPTVDNDTGLTREQTEDMMRTIGYVL